jgi:tRNA dimethylallyltransferase
MGATASGKSDFAEALAERLSARLINADAFQVYRGFDIGTNKPADREKYDLIDLCEPNENFGVGQWIKSALPILTEAWENQQSVIIVGGTGFYIRALFEEYNQLQGEPSPELRAQLMQREADEGLAVLSNELTARSPETAAKTDLQNPVRVRRALERLDSPQETIGVKLPPFPRTKFGLRWPQEVLEKRIEARTDHLMESWRREVRHILQIHRPVDAPAWRAIGYQSIADWERGGITQSEARETIIRQTRQYAKRQMTWLRAEPGLIWIELNGMAPDWGALAEGALTEMVKVREF